MERLLVHHVLVYRGQEIVHTEGADGLHHDHLILEVVDVEGIVAHHLMIEAVIIEDHQDVEVIKDAVIQDLVQIHVKIDIENDHVHLEVIVNVHYLETIVEALLIRHRPRQTVAADIIVRQKYKQLAVDPDQDTRHHHNHRINRKVAIRIANHQVQKITT